MSRTCHHTLSATSVPLALIVLLQTITIGAAGELPLHQRIDAAIASGDPEFENTAAAIADDAEFLRRATLDLTGRLPQPKQVRDFLADESPDKRAALIDRLLASPEYARRMQTVFDVMLMERRPDKYVKASEWQLYLRESFAKNKPWDELTREMLTADGSDPKSRPAAKFLLDRELKIDEVTRDLGRMFLGRDMQCAQCHDHPVVTDYLQRHYYGLSAFLNRSYVFKDPKTKQASIGEKAEGLVKFTSVFTNETNQTSPRLLDFPTIDDPAVANDPYVQKPDKKTRGEPIYSRRLKLADALLDPANKVFRENIVNRLWALMMGRGIVEPVDMWSEDNPPSHPQLVALLAEDFQANGYDIRYFLRELALTKTYARSSRHSGDSKDLESRFAVGIQKPLSPEQLAWALMDASGLSAETMDSLIAAELKKDPKNGPEKTSDPIWREQALHTALDQHVQTFAGLFGVRGVQTSQFDASVNQALFLRNGSLVASWLAPKGKNLTARLSNLDKVELVDELFISVFCRLPTDEERREISTYLESNSNRRAEAIKDLAWAALTSAEFRFNH